MQYVIDSLPGEIDWTATNDDGIRRTLQNAKNILMTRMGEVPYNRCMGIDQSIFDLPKVRFDALIAPEVTRALMYEWDCKVVKVETKTDVNGECIIYATLEVEV